MRAKIEGVVKSVRDIGPLAYGCYLLDRLLARLSGKLRVHFVLLVAQRIVEARAKRRTRTYEFIQLDEIDPILDALPG